MKQITLTEYEPFRGAELSPNQIAQLRTVAPSIEMAPSLEVPGSFDLTPGSSVGAVQIDDLQVVIRPKLPIHRLMFLVSYAVTHGRWQDAAASLVESDDILEAIIPGFAYQLRKALTRGVLQGYRSIDESGNTLRGRWRIGEQIRSRFGLAPPLEVTYDDFTEDIEANRLLRAAIHAVLRLRIRSDQARWGLRSLESTLAAVQVVTYDSRRIPRIRYDRRSERYRPAVELARLILQSSSFDSSHGATPASGFLIDMNRVFEDFVVLALRDALDPSGGALVQGANLRGLHLDVDRRIALQPDLSLWRDGTCHFVGDAKYKRLRPGASPNDDLYQLLAYTIATGLPSGLLVYAEGEERPASHVVVELGKRLETVALRLDCNPERVLDQMRQLAERIVSPQLSSAA